MEMPTIAAVEMLPGRDASIIRGAVKKNHGF
jgi:hypothetical protein